MGSDFPVSKRDLGKKSIHVSSLRKNLLPGKLYNIDYEGWKKIIKAMIVYLEGFLPAELFADLSSDSFKSLSISSRYFRSSSESAVPGTLVCVKKRFVK